MTVANVVFIDTNIFRGAGFNFSAARIDALREVAKRDRLTLLMPETTEDEIHRHILRLSKENVASLRALESKAFLLKRLLGWPLKTKSEEQVVSKLVETLNSDCDEFFKLFNVVKLGNENINLGEVLEWWKAFSAPFSEKKSNEFIDAFTVSILLNHQAKTKTKIAVISDDDDWLQVCERLSGFDYYRNPSAYAESLNPNIKAIMGIKSELYKSAAILEEIRSKFLTSKFIFTIGWDSELSNIEIQDLSIGEFHVVSTDSETCKANFSAKIGFTFDATYKDIVADDIVLEYPHDIFSKYHNVISISGSVSMKVDIKAAKITEIINVELDENEYQVP